MGLDEVISSGNLKAKSYEDMTIDDTEAREEFVETTRTHQNICVSDMNIPFIEEEGDPKNVHLSGKCLLVTIT